MIYEVVGETGRWIAYLECLLCAYFFFHLRIRVKGGREENNMVEQGKGMVDYYE